MVSTPMELDAGVSLEDINAICGMNQWLDHPFKAFMDIVGPRHG